MSWRDTIQPVQSSTGQGSGSWRDTISPVEAAEAVPIDDQPIPEEAEISELESFGRGALQGATFGFADEIYGGLRQIGSDVSDVFTGQKPEGFVEPVRDEMGRVANPDELVSPVYKRERDLVRGANQEAEAQNPASFASGQIGGGVASSFVPGAAALIPAKGARFLTALGKGAAAGGLTAAGLSEEEEIEDIAKDIKQGALTGAAVGGAMNRAAPLARGFVRASKWAGRKMGNLLFDLTDDQIELMVRNPKAVRNALSPEQLTEEASSAFKKMQGLISKAVEGADDTLRSGKSFEQGAFGKNQLKDVIKEQVDSIEVIGPVQRKMIRTLNQFNKTIDDISDNTISEKEMKKLIQAVDQNINYADQTQSQVNNALKSLRFSFDDLLKQQNPDYAKAQRPVALLTGALKKARKDLGFKQETGQGFVPTDTTLSKLKSLPSDRKLFSQKNIERMDRLAGTELLDQATATGINESTRAGVTQGSRNTLYGGSILGTGGAILGGPMVGAAGAAIGTTAGFMKDRFGRRAGKALITGGSEAIQNLRSAVQKPQFVQSMGKFSAPLVEAAQKGSGQLGVTHYLLFKNNDQYREKWREQMEKENEE